MAKQGPATIPEYIEAAPPDGQPHLHRLHAILKSVAPEAEETIKWNTPFFVEPRFLFAFSAHKAHCSFAPVASAMDAFHGELETFAKTKGLVKFPYNAPLPEKLIRKMAEYCLRSVSERTDDGFW